MPEILAFRVDPYHQEITIHSDITPVEFCAEWLGLEGLSSEKKASILNRSAGTRRLCNQALSSALGVSQSLAKSWGSDFERMPYRYRVLLAPMLLYKQLCRIALTESPVPVVRVELVLDGNSEEVA